MKYTAEFSYPSIPGETIVKFDANDDASAIEYAMERNESFRVSILDKVVRTNDNGTLTTVYTYIDGNLMSKSVQRRIDIMKDKK
jgi:hypothetical protein